MEGIQYRLASSSAHRNMWIEQLYSSDASMETFSRKYKGRLELGRSLLVWDYCSEK